MRAICALPRCVESVSPMSGWLELCGEHTQGLATLEASVVDEIHRADVNPTRRDEALGSVMHALRAGKKAKKAKKK